MKTKSLLKKYLFLIPVLFSASIIAQSKAHEQSKPFIIDPAYSSTKNLPNSQLVPNTSPWIYGSGELESWRLQLLMARKDSAELKVGYPGTYHQPYNQITYRFIPESPVNVDRLILHRVGQGRIYINGQVIGNLRRNKTIDTLDLNKITKISEVQISLASPNHPPALLIEDGPLSTGNTSWQWKSDASLWKPVTQYSQNSENIAPHLLEDPLFEVKPVSLENGLFDFGRQLFGYIVIQSAQKPILYFGESATEAKDTANTVLEQTRELVMEGEGLWRSKVPLAFRYAYLPGLTLKDVLSQAVVRPGQYKGAFASSDRLLNQIWMNSAYTLRLNMHDFLLDGMKRDRLPWTGDMAMSLLVNSYTFSDKELARRSLVGLGRAGIEQTDINGIVDYSLWWIIAQDLYQLYYGDEEHLMREWEQIQQTLKILAARTDDKGFLEVGPEDWLFIDWVNQPKWTAVQIMWWWTQKSAVTLANRMGDTALAQKWEERSESLRKSLYAEAWHPERKAWLANPDSTNIFTRHPNFLAVVSGLTPANEAEGIHDLLENPDIPAVGTPYMAGFEMIARAQLGNIDYTLEKISDYWGGMIERGATSFWEAYDPQQQGAEQYAFYGRPYAKSLCHAWSSGPAAILPSQILGIKPLEDGWKRFTLSPDLGSLKWVSASVPTPQGELIVDVERKRITVTIPPETILELYGEEISGPQKIQRKLK